MHILVVAGHPDLTVSTVSKTWLDQVRSSLPHVEIHQLALAHDNFHFNIEFEQSLIKKADRIIFLYPMYWFDTPWLMQKWLEEVFDRDFYLQLQLGTSKEIQVGISTGSPAQFYTLGGSNLYPVDVFLAKIQAFAAKCFMHYRPHYIFSNTYEHNVEELLIKDKLQFLDWITRK